VSCSLRVLSKIDLQHLSGLQENLPVSAHSSASGAGDSLAGDTSQILGRIFFAFDTELTQLLAVQRRAESGKISGFYSRNPWFINVEAIFPSAVQKIVSP